MFLWDYPEFATDHFGRVKPNEFVMPLSVDAQGACA
jgi:hypothetical protein